MRRVSPWLIGCVIFGLGLSNLSATSQYFGSFTDKNSANANAVNASWSAYPVATGTPPTTPCPTGVTGNCGYSRQAYGSNYSSLAPSGGITSVGWHSYSPTSLYTCNSRAGSGAAFYMSNCLVVCTTNCTGTQHLSFSLGSNANLTQGGTGSNVNLFREPVSDDAYYLYTPGKSAITITPPSGQYFSAFDFYWGSVDTWNSITFTDTSGNTTTVYGTDLSSSGFIISDPNHTCTSFSCADVTSATIGFTPYCTTGQNPVCAPNWKSISFSACNSSGVCYPAFEFDNLQFKLSSNLVGAPTYSPTPEPSSMLLLGSGLGSVGVLLRRKLRRPGLMLPTAIS
jgi:PEP-CTERM motif